VVLGLVVGLTGGVVLALAAGARRTSTSYQRFLVAHDAADVQVSLPAAGEPGTVDGDRIRALPNVTDVEVAGSFFVIRFGAGVGVVIPHDSRLGTSVNRFKMLEGRPARADRPSEAVVSFALAQQYGVRIGSKIPVLSPDVLGDPPPELGDQATALLASRARILDLLPENELTVVGIEAAPGEFPPQIEGTGRYLIHASPALSPVAQDLASFSDGHDQALVRLRHGSRDVDGFLADLDRLGPNGGLLVQRDVANGVNRSVHTQATALWLLALLTALAGALVLGQLVARSMHTARDDVSVLTALGMRRRERFSLGIGHAAVIGVVGGVVGVTFAAAASAAFPTGLARIAEPSPGVHVDVFVLGAGALGIALIVLLMAAWPAWRAARTPTEDSTAERRPRWERTLTRTGAPAPVQAGVRMAMRGNGGNGTMAVHASLGAITLGVATLVAAITFGASLTHLLSSPLLYGKTWDAALTTYDKLLPTRGVPVLTADHRVTGVAVGRLNASLDVAGNRVDGLAIDSIAGNLRPRVLEGRAPRAAGEIALGARTLRSLGLGVGDIVPVKTVASDRAPTRMRIVGRAVFPLFGELGRLGDGAFLTTSAYAEVQGRAFDPAGAGVLIRVTRHRDLDAVVARLERELGNPDYGVAVISQGKPTDIVNFGRVESTPYLLGGVLAAISLASLAYVLVTAVHRRRHDLAIYKTLGFVRRQVRATVAWQATTVIGLALVAGIPLGVIAGRWVWTLFAEDLGIVVVTRVPVTALLLTMAVALAAANLIAAVPALIAARTRPAQILRAE
jgi:ABC-type lipoprotein release transport system permease subunit